MKLFFNDLNWSFEVPYEIKTEACINFFADFYRVSKEAASYIVDEYDLYDEIVSSYYEEILQLVYDKCYVLAEEELALYNDAKEEEDYLIFNSKKW